MSKIYLFLSLFFSLISFSQNIFSVSGKLVDENLKLPLESATIYFSKVSDSTVIDYTISDKNGNFNFKLKSIDYPVYLKVSYTGFLSYKKQFSSITKDIDLETIYLKENISSLNEVIVKSEIPPITVKTDTLEFNASSFKVRPDANVETLLKQLPGVEVDADGKITVNGKEVNQVLVNGKPFFDKDGKIALQNLPSDIINKVQISDTKTKKEEQTNSAASSNNASINLTIDEDKNKGFFGKFMGGYGSDDRYESSVLVNYFKNKRKLSVLASSNNINSSGFSMDEVFDNMGGGRNRSVWVSDNGSFNINGRQFGSGNGITRTNLVGINYSDEWTKNTETALSYFLSDSKNKNVNIRNQTSFLPSGDFTTNSSAITENNSTLHNFTSDFEIKIDSTTTISVVPNITRSKTIFRNQSTQSSFDQNNDQLNESLSDDYTENNVTNFKNNLYFTKSFNRKKNYISFEFGNDNSKTDDDDFTNSSTVFFQNGQPSDIRNQYNNTVTKNNKYNSEFEFSKKITDSLTLKMGADYDFGNTETTRNAFNFDNLTQDFTSVNDLLTNYYSSKQTNATPRVGLAMQKKKFNFDFNAGTSILNNNNEATYLGAESKISREYIVPFVTMYGGYSFTKSKSIWVNYSYENNLPTARQILPIEDLANPLNTVIGNPNLNLEKFHTGYFSYRNYDYATRSGYGIYAGGSLYDNQIISVVSFDENRKRTSSYENISGTYNSWMGLYWNKSYKHEAHKFRISARLNNNFGLTKGITDNVLYTAKTSRISPNLAFTYDYGELLTINPTYNVSFTETNYTNYVIDKASNTTHRFGIHTTNYWPKNWVFGNDFSYTYNSNISNGFRKDFYLLNTSLSYSFYKKMFTAKVKIYDLLNQNLNTTRSINSNTIIDEENIVLKRYVMFSLTYKLEKFGGKEKKSSNRFWMN